MLKGVLSHDNQVALLTALSGKTLARAREVLATFFPRPDVPASIRKLPERRVGVTDSGTAVHVPSLPFESIDGAGRGIASAAATAKRRAVDHRPESRVGRAEESGSNGELAGGDACALDRSATANARAAAERTVSQHVDMAERHAAEPTASRSIGVSPPMDAGAHPSRRAAIEPLSHERYRVQFTADAQLKQKLELARDLLRHAVPSGDWAAIIDRALDLLLEETERRRFGKTSKPRAKRATAPLPKQVIGNAAPATAQEHASTAPARSEPATPVAPPSGASRHIPAAVRRAVIERDGLQCTWAGPDGTRCQNRAWLEHDHIIPRGMGGPDDPANLRIRCGAHNRHAAEQAYGQATITRVIAARNARRPSTPHVTETPNR